MDVRATILLLLLSSHCGGAFRIMKKRRQPRKHVINISKASLTENSSDHLHPVRLYETKAGAASCKDSDVLEFGGSYLSERQVQDKCDALKCAAYTWDSKTKSAWFCKTDADFDWNGTSNLKGRSTGIAGRYQGWKFGRPVHSSDGTDVLRYASKVGRGGCPDDQLLQHSHGFTSERSVQNRCDELHCKFYIWCNNETDESCGHAWFCRVDSYDAVDNAADWPKWKVGRSHLAEYESRASEPRIYESKAGRGGCPDEDDLLQHSHDFATEEQVQKKCDALGCAFYTWSLDEKDSNGDAWFCEFDSYDSVDNAEEWPHWKVGHPKQLCEDCGLF